ncbi:hypothetical protein [Streptacidiphilus rugosus]|uniref:hypothetical protein n=1 Tax=Streptacidiphilus rugosus TaxID=405783 RepID=UPI000566462B|nr:hypothetical protein [Streptacidiphilus rugosus]
MASTERHHYNLTVFDNTTGEQHFFSGTVAVRPGEDHAAVQARVLADVRHGSGLRGPQVTDFDLFTR